MKNETYFYRKETEELDGLEKKYNVCLIHFSDGMKKMKLSGPYNSEKDAEEFIEKIQMGIKLKPGMYLGISEEVTYEEYDAEER